MFLIRTAFWLAVVIMFLPEERDPAESVRKVSTFEAVGAARVAVSDMSGFCGRNPGTCEIGSALMRTFGNKARYGARMVTEFLDEKLEDPATKEQQV